MRTVSRSRGEALSVRPPVSPGPPSVPPPARVAPAAHEPSAFARVLLGLGAEVRRGESLAREALAAGRSGRDLGAAELIALQAGVYRYSEAVDLAARLVDRAAGGLKTIIQGQ